MTGFVNVLLMRGCPQEVRNLMFGGSLIALSKKSGGLRPIVIGYVWRRLTAKCANKYAMNKLAPLFAPLQVGIGTPGGGEAAVHAARGFVTDMTPEQTFVKLDFANAFNTLRRDVMLRAVHDIIPELYAFTHQAYSAESLLQFGSFEVKSQMGPPQGDPLGPLLFCLPLQPILHALKSDFRLGYLDDISLGGTLAKIRHDLGAIEDLEQSLGINLNRNKCEYFADIECSDDLFAGFQRVDRSTLTLLGAPLFKGTALDVALQEHSDTLVRALSDLSCLQAQGALMLLRSCFGAPRLTYLLRTAQCWGHPLLETIDAQMRQGLEDILNIKLSDVQWLQATLPIRDSGLGVRRITTLASSAYLASAASTKTLGAAILDRAEWTDDFKKDVLYARRLTLPTGDMSSQSKQKTWDRPLIELDKTTVWSANTDPLNKGRLGAIASPHAGDWLSTVPIASCGLGLSNEAMRVAVGLRLGLKLCIPHQCQCGEVVDPCGHHGLVCKQSGGRSSRHFAMNDIIWRAFQRADIPSSKEPPGLLRSDGKRPDGATLVPWSGGKYLAWDATSVHTCATSYIHLTSTTPGSAAELAASRKITKYACLPATHDFVPVALESLGPINQSGRDFLAELGRRITVATGDPLETMHLFQRLSICTQRFNAIAFRGTFTNNRGDEDREPH